MPVGPAWLQTGYGSVWASKIDSGSVLRIDPSTNKVVATIKVGSHPELGIGIGLGSVWIADMKDRSVVSAEVVPLSQIDPRTNRLIRQYVGGTRADTLKVGFGSAWIVEDLTAQIWKITLDKLSKAPL